MKNVVYTLIIMLAAFSMQAQENRITPPEEDDIVVGAIGGKVDISALGGATYTIPIQIPDGIDGMQPNLSIVYNSQGGNGLLGWGWNLGGLSAITRVNHTNYHDGTVRGIKFDNDRFALDGQRLMVLDGRNYGANGAEYKTETDGMNKIVSYTNPRFKGPISFKVWTADGLILEYGNAQNSRVVYDDGSGKLNVVIWLLNRVENRDGTYMVYNYDIHDHDYRLNNIQYSGHPGDRTTVYGIDFHYNETRTDKESAAIGNYMLYQPWLLKDITIYHWSRELSKYDFVYDENSGLLDSPYYYNRLLEIHHEYEGTALNPTIIDWGNIPVINNGSYPSINDMYITRADHDTYSFNGIQGKVKFVGDLNGDGFQDFICAGGFDDGTRSNTNDRVTTVHSAYVFLNTGHNKTDNDSGEAYFIEVGKFNVVYDLRWVYICDLDGDGIDEVLLVGDMSDGVYGTRFVNYDIFKINHNNRADTTQNIETKEPSRFGAGYVARDDSDVSFSIFGDGSDFIWDGGHVAEYYLTEEKNYSFIVGDFLGKGHCDIIFTFPYKHFVYLYYDEQSHYFNQRSSNADWNGLNYTVGDFDGDGRTEVWFDSEFDDNPGVIAKVYINNENRISWYPLANMMDKWNRNFTGDFNGDGHTDILTYRKDTHSWNILLFKQDWHSYPVFDVTESMARFLGIMDPALILKYSIQGKEEMPYYLEVADADGDGKSDVILRNNDTFAILYGPPIENGFTRIEEHNNHNIGINPESACGLCAGNFLAQENIAVLSNEKLYSFPQHSVYYNVASISDGMGNRATFAYDYLTNNPKNETANIYTMTDMSHNLGYDIYHTPLSLKAASRIESENINIADGSLSIDSYFYEDATIHKQGRGFLGFGKITHDRWQIEKTNMDNQRHVGKSITTSLFAPMGGHPMLVPVSTTNYCYRNDNQEVTTSTTKYTYRKAVCCRDHNNQGSKVFMPLVSKTIIDEYELMGERNHLRRRISENEYNNNQQFGTLTYETTVGVTESRQGTDENYPENANQCEYQTMTQTVYAPMLNSNNLWMPNRPHSVFTKTHRLTEGYNDSKSLTVYSAYNREKPYLPEFINTYPSGMEDSNDPFAMTTWYTYYPSGKLKDESHYPILGRSEDGFKTMYDYSPYYQFLTKKTEEFDTSHTNDYVTSYEYDEIYGNLIAETDCNGFSSYTENPDQLGLTVRSYNRNRDAYTSKINGTEKVTALRWLSGSGYENHTRSLDGYPAYFSWSKSEGAAEALTIYDYMGRELRSVSYGFRESGSNIIYQDTEYDTWGRVSRTTEPYFSNVGQTRKKWITYEYDDFDRLVKTNYPSYTLEGELIKPFTAITHDGKTTTTETGADTPRGIKSHKVSTEVNVMGWPETNKEFLDPQCTTFNTTTYGYNADGSLAWTMVNNDESTKISIQYDAAGNREVLNDPDYGTVTSHYNAFGQLEWQETPKGNRTTYHYDGLGRQHERLETDNRTGITETTTWNYSETPGQKGLLQSITLDDKQTITYQYDAEHYNNLTTKTERLFGRDYNTTYAYDDINFPQRVSSESYPSGYDVERRYDNITGNLIEIRHNNKPLWTTKDANALGQITKYKMGNGVTSQRTYDSRHFLSSQQASKGNVKIQDFTYSWDIFANLATRTENKFTYPLEETFTYDYLNRLETITLNNGTPDYMKYDPHGRFKSKMREGQTVFENAKYETFDDNGILKPHAISEASAIENAFGPFLFQNIEYNLFDKVKRIDLQRNKKFWFEYGYDHQCTCMYTTVNGVVEMRKVYVGNVEFITGFNQFSYTYLTGPMGVFAVVLKTNNTEECQYVYKDHLGSWTTITDAGGSIIQEQSFDAWGNCRNPFTWTGYPSIDSDILIRGFCGHEHLWITTPGHNDIGLINMNGRIYDPIMSSFLSVDNYVQAPESSQNFNRYAYCMNNPLKYTDPSGEVFVADDIAFAIIIGAAIGATSAVINNCVNGQPWYSDIGYSAVLGGVTGAVGACVGGAVGACLPFGGFCAGAISGAAGGFAGGFVQTLYSSGLSEEAFKKALISGGIGALSGSLIGGLSRGYVDKRNGYSFWDGEGNPLESIDDELVAGTPEEWKQYASWYNKSTMADNDIDLLKTRLDNDFNVQEKVNGVGFISTKPTREYGMLNSGRFVNLETGQAVGGYIIPNSSGYCKYYISHYYTNADDILFRATAGHELIHAWHYHIIANCYRPYSEQVAYKYKYDILMKNGYIEEAMSTARTALKNGYPFYLPAPLPYPFHPVNTF